MRRRRPSAGFTLVEAIMVIVIIGILSAMVAVFIRAPILGYRDAAARADLSDQADLALRRIARDLRAALPNSVRVLTSKDAANKDVITLEFLQTVSGGRYLAAEDNVSGLPVLDFEGTQANPNQFTVIAPPASFAKVKIGDLVAVYNLGDGFEPSNAYQLNAIAGGKRNVAAITAIGAAQNSALGGTGISATTQAITLAANPFKDQDTAMPSPDMRFQVVRGPVSYVCKAQGNSNALWRVWGYPIAATQAADPAGGQRTLIASGLTSCTNLFNYSQAANRRSGLVIMTLQLTARTDNVTVRLVHQVHVDNTP